MARCHDCKTGKLYERKMEDDYIERNCYVCGYHWNDSEGYDELTVRLHKEFFPREFKWIPSAEFRHLADSADKWTQ